MIAVQQRFMPTPPLSIIRDSQPAPPMQLRDYQAGAIFHIRQAVRRGERDFYITLPTGTGKAVILSHAAQLLAADGRILVIVHTKELVRQLADQLRRVFSVEDVGIVMNVQDDPGCRVVVACVATLRTARRLQRILAASDAPIAALLIDECHHATPTNTYGSLVKHIRAHSPDVVVMGCTATPYRNDAQKMQHLLPRCVFARDIADMQAAGWLADLTWRRIQMDVSLADLPTSRIDGETDYATHTLALTLNKPAVNMHIAKSTAPWLVGRRVLVFGADVAHAQDLAAAYHQEGITAAPIWGEMKATDRDATLAAWRAGEIQAVTNCQILTEGFDYPAIDAIVIAHPTQSLARYMQMLGRGTRLAPGKTDCLIIDCVGNEDRTDSTQIVLPDVMPITADATSATDEATARDSTPRGPRKARMLYLVDPRHDERYVWQFHEPSKCYFLRLDTERICVLTPDPTGSGLYRLALITHGVTAHSQKATTRAKWLTKESRTLPDTRAYATAWLATHAQIWISQKDRYWRSQPATEKQLALLATHNRDMCHQAMQEQWTRGTVAAALDSLIFGAYNAHRIAKLWEGGNA